MHNTTNKYLTFGGASTTMNSEKDTKIDRLRRFGFSFEKGGAHSARTIMLDELNTLLDYIDHTSMTMTEFQKAIVERNCLGKRSLQTRKLTRKHLVELYSLNPSTTIFRALLYFWKRDHNGHPLLAFLCAYARDPILRTSAQFILNYPEGAVINRNELETFIDDLEPGRFSKATLQSTAQNIVSSWTKSGHLQGKAKKVRSKAKATSGVVSYALFLGYLNGIRGEELFHSEYAKLLDCPVDRAIELAEDASRQGWIVFKRVGTVIEASFPNLLTEEELAWIREQD